MNRQQIRREQRKRDVSYSMTAESIHRVQEEAYKKAREELQAKRKEDIIKSFEMTLCVFMLYLRDSLGFGKKRLEGAMEKIVNIFNDWSAGLFSVSDVLDSIEEETGFKLCFDTDFKDRKIKLKK